MVRPTTQIVRRPIKQRKAVITQTPKDDYVKKREKWSKLGQKSAVDPPVRCDVGVMCSETDESAGDDVPFLPTAVKVTIKDGIRSVMLTSVPPIHAVRQPLQFYMQNPPKALGIGQNQISKILLDMKRGFPKLPDPVELQIGLLRAENAKWKAKLTEMAEELTKLKAQKVKSPVAVLFDQTFKSAAQIRTPPANSNAKRQVVPAATKPQPKQKARGKKDQRPKPSLTIVSQEPQLPDLGPDVHLLLPSTADSQADPVSAIPMDLQLPAVSEDRRDDDSTLQLNDVDMDECLGLEGEMDIDAETADSILAKTP
jgi:hypothetical protein